MKRNLSLYSLPYLEKRNPLIIKQIKPFTYMQWCETRSVSTVYTCSGLNQLAKDIIFSRTRCQVHRCLAILVFGVSTVVAAIQHLGHHCVVTHFCGPVNKWNCTCTWNCCLPLVVSLLVFIIGLGEDWSRTERTDNWRRMVRVRSQRKTFAVTMMSIYHYLCSRLLWPCVRELCGGGLPGQTTASRVTSPLESPWQC